VAVVAIVNDAAAAAEDHVELAREAAGEAAHGTGEPRFVGSLDDQVRVVTLEREGYA
jgi:Cu/Ag efflux protein CusF